MLTSGTRIRHYQLIRELGRGAMGSVFLARDTRLGRRVAMKFLAAAPELTERSLTEARATARCSHENIVVIHDVDVHEGRPYMVFEYLDGQTLARLMDGRGLTPAHAVELIVPVVRALERAHAFGIVHRDLKPENIFVTTAGAIKVLDFGVAKLFAPNDEERREVPAFDPIRAMLESVPAGTLPYMAPEQVFMDVDHRADLWAVGVILFEMLTGRRPLDARSSDQLMDELMDLDMPMPPLGATGVPAALERIVERCLAKRKTARFASARELLAELEPLLPRRYGRPLAEDESPFPGLAAFQEADAARYFGRAQDVVQLLSRLRQQPFVALAGPSGVGKSSLLRAGLVPALAGSGESWQALLVRPGRRPIASLASALARHGGAGRDALATRLGAEPGFLGAHLRERGARIVVIVDPLEEVYTLGADAAERAAFLASLAALADDASSPLRLVVALRSDFLDRLAEDRVFTDELARGLIFVRPLGRDGLREALCEPLALCGHAFETNEIVDDVLDGLAGTAGALPLLQFAAAKLWERRDRGRKLLTRAVYDAMGGVSGALAAHADEVVLGLSSSAQQLARTLLCRLVTPERTRGLLDLADLRQLSPQAAEVVEYLAAARLLVVQTRGDAEGPSVELVHESLIASWPALRRWLDEDKEAAAFLAEIRAAARQWDARGRSPGLLWRGEALEEARLWRGRYPGELVGREAAFLQAGFTLATRSLRIRRRIIAATIGTLLALVAAGGVALISIRAARTEALEQAQRALAAEQRIKEQLAQIEVEQRKRDRANAQVAHAEAELKVVNGELEAALRSTQAESLLARTAASTASKLAVSLQRSNEDLLQLLEKERAHAEELARQRQQINAGLK